MQKQHPFKKWEVSISELETKNGPQWKVKKMRGERPPSTELLGLNGTL